MGCGGGSGRDRVTSTARGAAEAAQGASETAHGGSETAQARFRPADRSRRHARLGQRPEWIKVDLRANVTATGVRTLVRGLRLHTVCEEARCPNIYECWAHGTATFMIGGDRCTRTCGFCAIEKLSPRELDREEPRHVGEAVQHMKLAHAVVTAVNRDDLPDGGAGHFVATIQWIKRLSPGCSVEVLIPDFEGNVSAIDAVLDAVPEVLNHNIETVPRLYRSVRPQARYATSLLVLGRAADRRAAGQRVVTKSGMMVGLGETRDEIRDVMRDLRAVGVEVLTIGQYLSPSLKHLPVKRWYVPGEFDEMRQEGLDTGFRHVESGPFVRSSYHAHAHVPDPSPPIAE